MIDISILPQIKELIGDAVGSIGAHFETVLLDNEGNLVIECSVIFFNNDKGIYERRKGSATENIHILYSLENIDTKCTEEIYKDVQDIVEKKCKRREGIDDLLSV